MKICKQCGGSVRRTSRETLGEHVISIIGVYPHSCTRCATRQRAANRPQIAAAMMAGCLTVLGLSAGGYYVARKQYVRETRLRTELAVRENSDEQLTPVKLVIPSVAGFLSNQDITELSKSGVSSTTIIALIHKLGHDFKIDARSLASMKKTGASEEVILAMVDSSLPEHSADASSPGHPLNAANALISGTSSAKQGGLLPSQAGTRGD